MKYISILLILILVILAFKFGSTEEKDYPTRNVENFNDDWRFIRKSKPADTDLWEKVTIPHTTNIEPLVVNDQWQGISWYKKTFYWHLSGNQKVMLRFEGVMQEAELWLNNKYLASHKGGYLPFLVDLSDKIISGNNELMIKVINTDNPTIPPGKPLKDLDFNYYGGIYRDVSLITTQQIYITNAVHANKQASGGLLVRFDDITKNSAHTNIGVHVKNESDKRSKIHFTASLRAPNGESISGISNMKRIEPGSDISLTAMVEIIDPELWSPNSPALYNLAINLYADDELIDNVTEKVGIRKHELRADGFYLNDEKIFLKGTNRHQEYPYVGYAISDNAHFRDAIKIKNAGFDMVRLSHYPQDEAFLDACDELGLIVMNAIPGWQYFHEGEFVENSYQDVKNMIRRDRNHPSVIFWEVSLNESGMTDDYMVNANKILKQELPFDDTYSAGWIDHPAFDLYIPARQHSKAPDYWSKYNKNGRKILIAEYGDWEYYAQNAGFNQTAFEGLKEDERTSRQLREYGEKRLLQQALNFQEAANSNRMGSNTIGHANWLMFDYNRGYSNDLEASGISDIFRIPKFSYYFFKSQRKPDEISLDPRIETGPMVKLATYWTAESSSKVKVFSNCDEVALYLNDKLISRQKCTRNMYSTHLAKPPFEFKVGKFTPGTLRANGYINNKLVAIESVSTPGISAKLDLLYDVGGVAIDEDQPDLVFLYAAVKDKDGTTTATDSSMIDFKLISGNAELIGENPIRAKAGIASILLKTYNIKAKIMVEASSASGLKPGSVEIEAKTN